jgi:hypothetical protein
MKSSVSDIGLSLLDCMNVPQTMNTLPFYFFKASTGTAGQGQKIKLASSHFDNLDGWFGYGKLIWD